MRSDVIIAADPQQVGTLWGDKANSAVFDNSKLRGLVPNFSVAVPFAVGIRQTVKCFDSDPRRQGINDQANPSWDRLASTNTDALAGASQH